MFAGSLISVQAHDLLISRPVIIEESSTLSTANFLIPEMSEKWHTVHPRRGNRNKLLVKRDKSSKLSSYVNKSEELHH